MGGVPGWWRAPISKLTEMHVRCVQCGGGSQASGRVFGLKTVASDTHLEIHCAGNSQILHLVLHTPRARKGPFLS